MFSIEEYHQVIGSKLADLDIGVVVLNAGVGTDGHLYADEDKKVE